MTFKQWQAVVALAVQGLIAGWLVIDATRSPVLDPTVAATATKLMWAMLAIVGVNIVGNVIVAIVVSVARGEALKDERADERDKAVTAMSGRNAYFVLALAGLGTLLMLALGVGPVIGAYALFGAMLLAGEADSVSKPIYYHVG